MSPVLRAAHPLAIYLVTALLATGSGCAPRSTTPATTLTPLLRPDQLPTTSAAPSTTTAPSSDPSSPLLAALPEGECAYSAPLPAGEITFIVGERLYGVAPDGTLAQCLSTLNGADRGVVRWSPRGQRAIVNNATVFDDAGRRANGFVPENVRVRWVQPAGDALIGPTASSRTLVRREAETAARTEITFLSQTEVALSHPGGGQVIAAGESFDGDRGIFVASDTGGNPRPIVRVDAEGLEVTEMAADAGGAMLYYITSSAISFELHGLSFPGLEPTDITSAQAPMSDLTTGPVTGATAWKVGLCNSVTSVSVLDDRVRDPLVVGEGTPIASLSLGPVGWLDVNRLVVAARPLGCDGPADVWIWNRLDNTATLVVSAVEFPTVRTVAQSARPLALSPGAEVPVL